MYILQDYRVRIWCASYPSEPSDKCKIDKISPIDLYWFATLNFHKLYSWNIILNFFPSILHHTLHPTRVKTVPSSLCNISNPAKEPRGNGKSFPINCSHSSSRFTSTNSYRQRCKCIIPSLTLGGSISCAAFSSSVQWMYESLVS